MHDLADVAVVYVFDRRPVRRRHHGPRGHQLATAGAHCLLQLRARQVLDKNDVVLMLLLLSARKRVMLRSMLRLSYIDRYRSRAVVGRIRLTRH